MLRSNAAVKSPASKFTKPAALGLSRRSFYCESTTEDWNLIWEAGRYYERVVTSLEQANSYAIFVGWQIDSRLELTTGRHETFKDYVLRLCDEKPDLHIYFLMWDFAYFYAFEREALQSWVWDNIHERVHFVFDNRHPYGGSHHEKFVIVDGEIAFVGGVDICDDRWDTSHHYFTDARRSLKHNSEEHFPYHDMSIEVRGEVAADLVEYIGERWRALSSIQFPERPRIALSEGRGKHKVLVSRTKASVDTQRPLLIRETEWLYRDLIRQAKHQLVIENQYYWSKMINDEIIALMRRRAHTDFRIFLVVPAGYRGSLAFRMMGVFQTELLNELTQVARETGTHLLMGCPFSRGPTGDDGFFTEKSIYVHSKVILVDDTYMAIGSSNFNNRGFRLDTELTLTLIGEQEESRAMIRDYAQRIVGHWGAGAFNGFFHRPALTEKVELEPHVYLKPYNASWSEYLCSFEGRLAKYLPVAKVFDPPVPLTHFLKGRIAIGNPVRIRRVLPIAIWGAFLLSLGSTLSLVHWSGSFISSPAMAIKAVSYAFFLSVSWLLPFPTLFASLCAGIQFGPRLGATLSFWGVMVSALMGFGFSRLFPTAAIHFYKKASPGWLPKTLGLRRLPILLRVMLNPTLNFQSKIAYQGIFSIPVRWFVFVSALLAAVDAALSWFMGSILKYPLGWNFFSFFVSIATGIMLYRIYHFWRRGADQ